MKKNRINLKDSYFFDDKYLQEAYSKSSPNHLDVFVDKYKIKRIMKAWIEKKKNSSFNLYIDIPVFYKHKNIMFKGEDEYFYVKRYAFFELSNTITKLFLDRYNDIFFENGFVCFGLQSMEEKLYERVENLKMQDIHLNMFNIIRFAIKECDMPDTIEFLKDFNLNETNKLTQISEIANKNNQCIIKTNPRYKMQVTKLIKELSIYSPIEKQNNYIREGYLWNVKTGRVLHELELINLDTRKSRIDKEFIKELRKKGYSDSLIKGLVTESDKEKIQLLWRLKKNLALFR